MKAREIADAFRAQFAADTAFSAATPSILCATGQTGEDFTRPCVIFDAQDKALNSGGTALTYTLAAQIESSGDKDAATDPDPALAHAARVELVRAKLLATGKAALLAALNAVMPRVFDWRGWDAAESLPTANAHHFQTTIQITGTVLVV